MTENQYIKSRIQKDFWQDDSGTIEHTGVLRYIVGYSRNKKRPIIIKPFALKNAFIEVNLDLMLKVQDFNQLPFEIK